MAGIQIENLLMKNDNIVIGKENCKYCDLAVELLKTREINYVYVDYNECLEFIEDMRINGGKITFPRIFLNGILIGGYCELKRSF